MLTDEIVITRWPSKDAKRPGQRVATTRAGLLHELAQPPAAFAGEWEQSGWSPATFKGDKRAQTAVEALCALVFDVDKGASVEDLVAAVEALGLAGLVHTTKSHTSEQPRVRAVLTLSRDMTPAEQQIVWRTYARLLAEGGIIVDSNTKDAARFWYAPSTGADGTFVAKLVEGKALDVDAATHAAPPKSAPKSKPVALPVVADRSDRLARACAYARTADPAIEGQGGSNTAIRVAAAIGVGFDLTAEETLSVLESDYNSRCEPPWSRAELQHKVEDAFKTSPRERGYLLNAPPRGSSAPVSGSRVTLGVVAPASDLANAGRLVDAFGADLRFVRDWGKWATYDGGRWSLDQGRCLQLAADASCLQLEEAIRGLRAAAGSEDEADRKRAKAAYDWACKSQSAPRLNAALTLAAVEPRVSVAAAQLDAGPMLFNVENCTIDLSTGQPRAHRREDLLTKIAPVRFDPSAKCPTWDAFLLRAMGGDRELVSFLQRWSGYALTGDVSEHALVFHYGSGGNGKSTFCGLRLRMLGDYGMPAPRGLLFRRAVDVHPTELASLFGARLALVPETEDGQAFDEPKLKDLTGGDRISARRMNEDFWSFSPTHKLEICGNHKPVVRGTDVGIWRRQRLVPWNVAIPPEEQDKHLGERLWAERSGILNWMVAGCLEWQRVGLAPPKAVTEATEAYREESDPLGEFFALCCVFEAEARVARSHLRTAYEEHCTENGVKRPLDAKAFGRRLRELGCEDKSVKVQGRSVNGWAGIRLRDLEREPVGSNTNGRAEPRLAKVEPDAGTHSYPRLINGGGQVGSKWVPIPGQEEIRDPRVSHNLDLIPTRYPPTHHETSGAVTSNLEELYEATERYSLQQAEGGA